MAVKWQGTIGYWKRVLVLSESHALSCIWYFSTIDLFESMIISAYQIRGQMDVHYWGYHCGIFVNILTNQI